jgi:hypothetical protein
MRATIGPKYIINHTGNSLNHDCLSNAKHATALRLSVFSKNAILHNLPVKLLQQLGRNLSRVLGCDAPLRAR